MKRLLPIALPAFLSAACAVEPPVRLPLAASAGELDAASRIRLLPPEVAARTRGRGLGPVEGMVCQVGLHDPEPRQEEAVSQLRLAAFRRGANAIVHAECEAGGVSLADDCFATVTCRGEAIVAE